MEKSWKFQGGGGSNAKPSGMENPVGWGGGDGYFLEPHIVTFKILTFNNNKYYDF